MTDDVREVHKFAVGLAREAGELLRGYFNTEAAKPRLKADATPVTDADIAADTLISERIRAAFPDDLIISEEHNTQLGESPLVGGAWVIDPLDGTSNFVRGLHTWGVSLARLWDGQPQVGALYFPILNEVYSAMAGGGAFLNGVAIAVRAPDDGEVDEFYACCNRAAGRWNFSIPYKARVHGSAAYDFCLLARGVVVVMLQARPKLWDIAGGWLVCMEAGAALVGLDGAPFPPAAGDLTKRSYATLGASTAGLLERVRAGLAER